MKSKKLIEKNYAFDKNSSKDRETKLQKQLADLYKENNDQGEEILNLQKSCKQLVMDKEKSKARIQKLIQRKGKFDSGLQTCKKCSKEFNENENYNWSCRTHQSEYSGEMWWCCGKTSREALGCKYSAHESKDDDEDDDLDGDYDDGKQSNKYVRCTCCKEIGHTINECPRDPNLKTGHKADEEYVRI